FRRIRFHHKLLEYSMKFVSVFVLSLLVLTLNDGAFGRDTNSAAQNGSFIPLKQGDGREFRAFVAGPADAKAAVLVVHDYFGISDATKQSVQRLDIQADRKSTRLHSS